MLRSHEVPLGLLEHSLQFNDFDYALVHLFKEYPLYYDFYKKSLKNGREVILDNSVFELGVSFEEEGFEHYVRELNPTYYIIPDKFGDRRYTEESVSRWIKKGLKPKTIGVVQGDTLKEMILCYEKISLSVDMVAISFAQKVFLDLFPYIPKDQAYMFGRLYFINTLIEKGLIVNKPHHLLGCSLPQELLFYKSPLYNFIRSVDTSSPVLHAIFDKYYDDWGLNQKIKEKMADLINIDCDKINPIILRHNLEIFKNFVSCE